MSKTQPTSKIKARLVEGLVASFHESGDVKVERNVRVPDPEGPTSGRQRKREIDVLVTGAVEGHEVRFAIECKNYGKPIGVELIDAFVGKLLDIGIPFENGIYVSPHGFTAGAKQRADKAKIQTLILTGLTPDRLASQVEEAIQSVVYLFPHIIEFHTLLSEENLIPAETLEDSGPMFLNSEGEAVIAAPDCAFNFWQMGIIPSTLGTNHIDIKDTGGLYSVRQGYLCPLDQFTLVIKVSAYVINFKGQGHYHSLVDAKTGEWQKMKTRATFESPSGEHPVSAFETEEELQTFLQARAQPLQVAQRIPLPRIKFFYIYWPPSERAVKEMKHRFAVAEQEAAKAGRKFVPDVNLYAGIESTDLSGAWEK